MGEAKTQGPAPASETARNGMTSAPGEMEYDGLFWRRMAYRGAIVGPEIWKRVAPIVTGWVIFTLVGENADPTRVPCFRPGPSSVCCCCAQL